MTVLRREQSCEMLNRMSGCVSVWMFSKAVERRVAEIENMNRYEGKYGKG